MWKNALLLSGFLIGCTQSIDPELAYDQEAADEEAAGKSDGVTFTRLERTTAAELAAAVQERYGAALAGCFAAYQSSQDPTATEITKDIARKFVMIDDPACGDGLTLAHIVGCVLDATGVSSATPDEISSEIAAWATPQFELASPDGFVSPSAVPVMFFNDLLRVQDDNAMTREQDPRGIDLGELRTQWSQVRKETTLDRLYLNPVTFPEGALEGSQLFRSLRSAFPLRGLSLEATRYRAITDFSEAAEGVESDPASAPIADALRQSSIRKRFYFAGAGGGWSRNILIVVDEHDQVYGLQIGYSE